MRAAENDGRPIAYATSACAVNTASAAPNFPLWNSSWTMGPLSAARPTAAGTVMKAASLSAKPSVPCSASRSRRAAWAAMLGSAAVATDTPKTPRGNSMTRSA